MLIDRCGFSANVASVRYKIVQDLVLTNSTKYALSLSLSLSLYIYIYIYIYIYMYIHIYIYLKFSLKQVVRKQ